MSNKINNDKKLILLDGLSLINRAFYALPPLSTKDGTPTNAIIGFLNIFFKLMDEEKPNLAAACFDMPKPTFRHKQYTEYKATRKPFPQELVQQIPILKDVLTAMGVPIVQAEGYEADDIMGTLATKAETAGFSVTVVSGDRDLLQIATNHIKVRIPKTSKGQTTTEDYFAEDFFNKMGITPKEYIDMKALMGDASDNIPGVPSIGEKTALKIIQEYSNIENAIADAANIKPPRAAANLAEHADLARLSKQLATIVLDAQIDVNIESLRLKNVINTESITMFKKLELKSFVKKYENTTTQITPQENKTTGEILRNSSEIAAFMAALTPENPAIYLFIKENKTITGLAIAADKNAYIPITDSFAHVAPFFESGVPKIGFNTKNDLHLLRKQGITMQNLTFDVLLAGYLLENIKDGDDLNDISLEYLGTGLAALPASQAQLSLLDDIGNTAENAADNAFAQISAMTHIYPIVAESLVKQGLDKLFYEIEMPLLFVLADMETYGIRLDAEFIRQFGEELTEKIDILTKEIHILAGGEFNINSTKQLGKVLFEDMGIRSLKKTKTGHSTSVEVLEKLAPDFEIAAKILEYRTYTKLRSTYVDGLLAAMDDDGKIRTTFNQASTATGRLSSVEPNLQNIPIRTELGRKIRRAFVADDGFCFVDADYSQIELRVLAELSQDPTFLTAFANNQDIHTITAAQVFGLQPGDVTPEKRYIAKAVNFGIVYGISAYSLAEDIKVSVREAEGFIRGYFSKYPQVKAYLDTSISDAKTKGYAETIFARKRHIPELSHSNFNTRSFGERVAMNMPVQGTAADIIKIAMIKVHKRLKDEGLQSRLVLQVHDELLIEAKNGEEERVAEILRTEMENAVSLQVPLAIDVSSGVNWHSAH